MNNASFNRSTKINLRIYRINVVNGNSSFDRSQSKSSWLLVFVFKDCHTTMLGKKILQKFGICHLFFIVHVVQMSFISALVWRAGGG